MLMRFYTASHSLCCGVHLPPQPDKAATDCHPPYLRSTDHHRITSTASFNFSVLKAVHITASSVVHIGIRSLAPSICFVHQWTLTCCWTGIVRFCSLPC